MKRMTTQHSIAWLLLTILPLLITGCWDQRPIENLAIIIALGADTNQQNPNLADYTFGYPLYAELKRSAAKIVTTGAPT
jgi:serine protease inhibitor